MSAARIALGFALGLCACGRPADAPSGSGRLGQLAWLAGDWSSEDAGHWAEQHWSEARAGAMIGTHREGLGDRHGGAALLTLREQGPSVVLRETRLSGTTRDLSLVRTDEQQATFRASDGSWLTYERKGHSLLMRSEGDPKGPPSPVVVTRFEAR